MSKYEMLLKLLAKIKNDDKVINYIYVIVLDIINGA